MTYCKRIEDKYEAIKYFYDRESHEWHQYIHKRGGSVGENIRDTYDSIENNSEVYGVYEDEKLVAYFAKYEENGNLSLNGFHVLKEYRDRQFLTQFWNIVKSKFERSIYTGIWERNEPALRTLRKAGFRDHAVVMHENKLFIILKY